MTDQHRAGRIPIDPQAFSHDLAVKRKRRRQTNADHLKFIRGLPCLCCGSRKDIQATHIRSGSPQYGKRRTGLGEKPGDHWTLPLCAEHHALQHETDEMAFWGRRRIDPFAVALALFAASGDDDAGELIVRQAHQCPVPLPDTK